MSKLFLRSKFTLSIHIKKKKNLIIILNYCFTKYLSTTYFEHFVKFSSSLRNQNCFKPFETKKLDTLK